VKKNSQQLPVCQKLYPMTATPLRLFVPRDAAVRLSLTALPIVLLSDNS